MALPIYPITKPSSRSTPHKLSRSQSLNLHNAKSTRSPRKTQQDGCEFRSFDKTDNTRTLPTHLKKRNSDTEHENPPHKAEFSAKLKLFFRRNAKKASREDGIGASDVTGDVGLPVTASEEKRESGSGLPTQAVNLGISRHLMTASLLDQNKSDISRSSKHHSSHRSTQWYDDDDEETDNKLLCWDSEDRPVPALGENGELMNEQEIKLLLDSTLKDGGSDSSPQSPSVSQLFTISEECVEDDPTNHTPALHLGANDCEDSRVRSSTPTVVLRQLEGLLPSIDEVMNRWSIAGSGIHDSPSLRELVVHDVLHEPKLSISDVALKCDSDSDDSLKDETRTADEDSRPQGSSDSILSDSVDLRMNASQSMLELPRCLAEDTPRMGRGSVLRRSASLTLGRSQKLVLQVFSVLLN